MSRSRLQSVPWCALILLLCTSALAAQGVTKQSIWTSMSVGAGAGLWPDGGGVYSDDESAVKCGVGSRRSILLELSKRSARRMFVSLGTELIPVPGEPSSGPMNFFAAMNVPDPSDGPDAVPSTADDGEISEVTMEVAWSDNVSGLGVTYLDTINYCDPNANPNDPLTFQCMNANMRVSFKSGPHQWRLYFGLIASRAATDPRPQNLPAPPVVIQRDFREDPNPSPDRDPNNPHVPWRVCVLDWETDPLNGRRKDVSNNDVPNAIVGYLYYRGTKRQDPWQDAGAFDVPWGPLAVTPLP